MCDFLAGILVVSESQEMMALVSGENSAPLISLGAMSLGLGLGFDFQLPDYPIIQSGVWV